MRFQQRNTHFTMLSKRSGNTFEPGHVYGIYNTKKKEFRFHIGQFEEFKYHLIRENFTSDQVVIEQVPLYKPKTKQFTYKPTWVLREKQMRASNFILEEDPQKGHSRLITAATGSGKALEENTLIQTPLGWTAIKDLKIGDDVVAWDGTISKVLGVFPQGLRHLYKVTFSDNRSVLADGEHLWKVSVEYPGVSQESVLELNDLIQIRRNNPGAKISIPLVVPADFPESSIESRKEALQRAMGETVLDMSRSTRYFVTNANLGELLELQDIARSLGGIAMIKRSLRFVLEFWFPDKKEIEILSVQTADPANAVCISIDHPDKLYVTEGYIVTHNTVIGMVTAGRKGSNVVVSVLPRYVEKWKSDVQNILDIDKKEIMALEKSDHLKGLINMVKEGGKPCKVTIIPLSLLTIFFNAYEEDPKFCVEDYGCAPEELYELLDVGFMLVDEGHEHFHTVYRLTCYMHTPLYVCLSGTMVHNDRFIANMQHTMYPAEIRFEELTMSKYIDVTAFQYRLENIERDRIKTSERGMTSYSHNAFEKSIMHNKKTRANYLRQIVDLVKYGYMANRKEGQKLLIFVALKDTCKEVRNHLRNLYPDLTIEKFVQGDPYKNLMDSDICVSTLGSAGTAHDIKGLTDVINTVSIDSHQKNRQALGRLRDLGETEVRFYYLYTPDVPTQAKYHRNKIILYQPFVRSHRTLASNITV